MVTNIFKDTFVFNLAKTFVNYMQVISLHKCAYLKICLKSLIYTPKCHIFLERISQVLLMHRSKLQGDKEHPSNTTNQRKHDIQLVRNL